MGNDDPYYDKRIYHKAHLIDEGGKVSALCSDPPRPLNLKKHELWTNLWEGVTCEKCLALKPK
jgi:hypothetical protein